MLEEIGAPYAFVATRPHSDVANAVNPSGKLPALKVGEQVIVDSAAICTYLADSHPEAGLSFPAGTLLRAQMESWIYFAMSELEPPLWMYTRQASLLPQAKRAP